MSRILIYYPSNARAVSLETIVLALQREGHEVALLTTCASGPLHEYLSQHAVAVYANPLSRRPSLLYYLRQGITLLRFCRRNDTDIIFSHLQEANIIAVWARFFLHARILPFRHHFAFVASTAGGESRPSRTEVLFDRLINRLSSTVIVPSAAVAEGMCAVEGVDRDRVRVVRYMYDFATYAQPDIRAVAQIRNLYPARLTLLMVTRLVPLKRPDLVFKATRELIADGLDVRLLVLGDGPDRQALEAWVAENELGDRIVLLGHRSNVVDYMGASDLLIHPSLTEASCNAVKEMALLGKPAVICEGVGDFNDYILDGVNSIVVPQALDAHDLAQVLRRVYDAPEQLAALGESLRTVVLERFGLSKERVGEYLALLEP